MKAACGMPDVRIAHAAAAARAVVALDGGSSATIGEGTDPVLHLTTMQHTGR